MPVYQHSSVLFTLDDGRPIRFQMPPCQEKSRLKEMVEHGGGILSSKYERNSLRLAVPGKKVHEDGAVDIKYITDCVEQNKLLKINKYKLHSGDLVKVKDDDMEPAKKVVRVEAKDKQGRKRYLLDEEMEIIRWLLDEGHYDSTGGNAVWKKLEKEQVIPGHSWQSMKDRYRKHMLPNIESYQLEDYQIAKLQGTISDKSSSKLDKNHKNKYLSMLKFTSHGESKGNSPRKKADRASSSAANSNTTNDSLNTSRKSVKAALEKSIGSPPPENIEIDMISPVLVDANRSKIQPSTPKSTNVNDKKTVAPNSFISPENRKMSDKKCISPTSFYSPTDSQKTSDVSETMDEFDKQLLNYANPENSQRRNSVGDNRKSDTSVSQKKDTLSKNKSSEHDFHLWKDSATRTDHKPKRKKLLNKAGGNYKRKQSEISSNVTTTEVTEVTSTSDVMNLPDISMKRRRVISSIASDEPSSSQVENPTKAVKPKENTSQSDISPVLTKDDRSKVSKFKFKSAKSNVASDGADSIDEHLSKYFKEKSSAKTKKLQNINQKEDKKSENFNSSDSENNDDDDEGESPSLLRKPQRHHQHHKELSHPQQSHKSCTKRLLRSNSQASSTVSSEIQMLRKKKKSQVLDNTSQSSSEDELQQDAPKSKKDTKTKWTESNKHPAKAKHSCRKNIRSDFSDDSEEIECIAASKSKLQSDQSKVARSKGGSEKHGGSLRSFLMAETQSTQSAESNGSDQSYQENLGVTQYVDKQEFNRAIAAIEKVSSVFGLTKAELLQVCHWVGGDLDEAVFYLLNGQTKTGFPAWKYADDMMLLDCNEVQYKTLEEKFGEMGVLRRQQYLQEENML